MSSSGFVGDLRYMLLQIRNSDDPMREQEVSCFARALGCDSTNIDVHDLIRSKPSSRQFSSVDAVLIGGSGDYSVSAGGPWLAAALDIFEVLFETSKPTFASCWGFQAFARALGGRVVTDMKRAEVGTLELRLTEAGLQDPLFAPIGPVFHGQLGHQDIVDELPDGAVLLASSQQVQNQAFTFPNKLIYATQFHPELRVEDLFERMVAYPEYLKKITGLTLDEFRSNCHDTPETSMLLRRFAAMLLEFVD